MEDMYSFWQLDRDVPLLEEPEDDEAWWEDIESEVAAIDREEQEWK